MRDRFWWKREVCSRFLPYCRISNLLFATVSTYYTVYDNWFSFILPPFFRHKLKLPRGLPLSAPPTPNISSPSGPSENFPRDLPEPDLNLPPNLVLPTIIPLHGAKESSALLYLSNWLSCSPFASGSCSNLGAATRPAASPGFPLHPCSATATGRRRPDSFLPSSSRLSPGWPSWTAEKIFFPLFFKSWMGNWEWCNLFCSLSVSSLWCLIARGSEGYLLTCCLLVPLNQKARKKRESVHFLRFFAIRQLQRHVSQILKFHCLPS